MIKENTDKMLKLFHSQEYCIYSQAFHGKSGGPLLDDCMREKRIREHPIELKGDYIIADRLEMDGTLKLFEYMGGPMYTPFDPERMENAVIIASTEISINHEAKEIRLVKADCSYGYDFIGAMIQQVLHFADFYGYSAALLNLKKNRKVDALK